MNVIYENKSEPIILMMSTSLSSLPHMHKEIEIIYVESGYSQAHADKEITDLKSGEVFISFPNQVHFYEKTVKGKYYVLIISPKVFFGLDETVRSNTPVNNCINPGQHFKDLIKNFVANKAEGDTTACVGYLNLMMSDILSKIKLSPITKTSDGTLREIMDYCQKNFTEDISLETVAQSTHLSRCYISHLFSSKLSLSFTDYINTLRINAACELLTETDKKISDISEDVGFGTIRSFNRAFLHVMGQTPQSYRRGFM